MRYLAAALALLVASPAAAQTCISTPQGWLCNALPQQPVIVQQYVATAPFAYYPPYPAFPVALSLGFNFNQARWGGYRHR